jgi:uncharacterized protein
VRSWPDAFRVLAAVLPDGPVVIVLDELPWLAEQDEIFDGALQTAWDRLLSRRPVLLLLLGSDLHLMERLTAYDRPFFGRADNLLLGSLNPGEVGEALGLDATDAIDASLLSGGLPGILRAWPAGTPALEFAERECEDPASPLFGVPEAALLAEFPAPDTARRVIEAVGGGNRTHANIAAEAGGRTGAIPQQPAVLPGDGQVRARAEQAWANHGRRDLDSPPMGVVAGSRCRTGHQRSSVARRG